MRTDAEIKDDIFRHIKGTSLEVAVTGQLLKTRRPKNSDKEDIVISVLANEGTQKQEAVVNVNIYVEDNVIDGQPEEDSIRCREIGNIAKDVLEVFRVNGARVTLGRPPRVFEIDDIPWHIVNCRLNYQIINE